MQHWQRGTVATALGLGAVALAGAAIAQGTTPAAAPSQMLIQVGNLIPDAATGAIGPASIAVAEGKIVAITRGWRAATPGETVVDQRNRTVVPGLIDMHVHLSSNPGGDYRNEAVDPDEWGAIVGTRNALTTARAGFTTVRDLGSARYVGYVLRRGTADGVIAGPRIVAAGPAISIIGGHGDVTGFRDDVAHTLDSGNTCTGAVECAAVVRKLAKSGSDVIKVTATGGVLSQQGRGLGQHFTDPELKSIADTAHSLGLKVAAHAHGARGVEAAAQAGIDTADHATFADDAALKAMKARGIAMVPTLMAIQGIKERLGKGIYTPVVEAKVRQTVDQMGKSAKAARALGVPIAFGTDAGVYEHGRNGQEFALYVNLVGMTNAEALASATTVAARALGMEDEIGRIAPGYSADFVAVDVNPLTDIRALENVRWVMVRGRIIP